MINKGVFPGPSGREPFRRAGTFKGRSANLEFVVIKHSVQGISNFSHRLHAGKVSGKASDKERQNNPTPNSTMSKLQGLAERGHTGETRP